MVATKKITKKKKTVKKKTTVKRAKAKVPTNNNLNHRFDSDTQARRRQGVVVENVSSVQLIFDEIETHLINELNKPNVHYALVISPWFSNGRVWKALSRLRGGAVLTLREKYHRSQKRIDEMHSIQPFKPGMDRVRCLQCGAGRQKSIIHQKVWIFLDGDRKPISAAWGSWNASGGGSTNIEMFSLSDDHRVATEMYQEFFRIFNISRRLCQ